MPRWKTLPGDLPPAVVRFVVALRQLKDRSGRSLRQIAADTGYSVSSWERYLGGRLLPPREAVESLAGALDTDAVRLLALYDTAAEAWGQARRGTAPDPPAEADAAAESGMPTEGDAVAEAEGEEREPAAVAALAGPAPEEDRSVVAGADQAVPVPASAAPVPSSPTGRSSRFPQLRLFLTAGVAAALGAAIALLLVGPSYGSSAACAPSSPAAPVAKPIHYQCVFTRRNGLWYSGNSITQSDQLEVDMSGPDVAELQCLLQHAGISPGGIDGNFGPMTESAVIQAQKKDQLDIDGRVGPKTWAALRG